MLITLLLAISSPVVCASPNSSALAKLQKIPSPSDYIPRDDNNPKIPVVVLSAQGVSVNHGPSVPFDNVLIALAALPSASWTQGKLILYYDSPPGISSPSDRPPPSAVMQVDGALKSAGIKVIIGASA